jgi:transcriptional regulator with XRE-family HTH domain
MRTNIRKGKLGTWKEECEKRDAQPPKPRPTRLKVPSGGKVGMPQIYDPARFPHIAGKLCADYGFTHEQLAKVFGVSKPTINDWMSDRPEFKAAVIAGRDQFDSEVVEKALLKRALGYKFTETTTSKVYVNGKDAAGLDVKVPAKKTVITTKEVPPDPKSCLFWLTNRNKERWALVTNVNAKVEGKIEHNHSGTVVTAQLENLNKEQLLALRDMVALQAPEQKQIGQISNTDIDMSVFKQAAEDLQREMYGDVEDAEVI